MNSASQSKKTKNVAELYQLARAELSARNFEKARVHARRITKLIPKESTSWSLLAEVETQLGQYEAALKNAAKAAQIDPDNISRLVQHARALAFCGKFGEAREVARKAMSYSSDIADLYLNLSVILANCLDHELALEAIEKAIELNPKHPTYLHNLATSLRFLGKLDEAEEACNKTLAVNPNDHEIIGLRSALRKQTREKNHIQDLKESLHQGVKSPQIAIHASYALAKELEDIEEYDESFKYLEQGSRLRRQGIQYSTEDDRDLFSALIECFTPEVFAEQKSGYESAEPIFVLGLPRTGSTLVERIITSHSTVYSAGELLNFGTELSKLARTVLPKDAKPSRREFIKAGLSVDFAALGKAYIGATRPFTGHTPHFLDKLPLNFLHVGLIHLALPNAKIVHVRRNPMDACYAIYKNLFNSGYPFSYEVQEIGHYYVLYHRLMAHWRDVIPGCMFEIHYEDLVADQETQSKALIDACGLTWEPQILEFHKSKAASTTASAAQVRQPIYSSSIEKWRRYEKQLAPLQEIFKAANIEIA